MNPTHPHAASQRRSHKIFRYVLFFLIVVIPTVTLAQDSMKSWTNTAGKTIQAEFIRLEGETVVIRKDGKVFNVPFSNLSTESHAQAQKLGKSKQHVSPELKEQFSALWAALDEGKGSETRHVAAIAALLQLADQPGATTKFLEEKLPPVNMTREELLTLLSDLGSDQEERWRNAYQKLTYCDPRLIVDYNELNKLRQTWGYPARNRLVDLLSGELIDSPNSLTNKRYKLFPVSKYTRDKKLIATGYEYSDTSNGSGNERKFIKIDEDFDANRHPDYVRILKSLVLLKSFDTVEAKELLKSMATGHPKAALTKIALSLMDENNGALIPERHSALWDELKPKLITHSTLERFEQVKKSTRVLLQFAAHPAKTTELFAQKLVPVKISRQEVVDLLSELGSEKDAVWRAAFANLSSFDPRLAIGIEELFELPQVKTYPARHRLADVLSRIQPKESFSATAERFKELRVERAPNNKFGNSHNICYGDKASGGCIPVSGELIGDRRTIYALVLLESFDTPEADKLIVLMASGHPNAIPTQVAQEILNKRKGD